MDAKPRQLVSAIEACFPEIRVKKCRKIRMGWETVVLDVNDKYIFRFLNLQRRWPHQQAEIDRLKWLKPKITTVEIPNYEFVWIGGKEHPGKFAGYRKIHGSPATQLVFRRNHIDRLGKDLGRFITELHEIPPQEDALVPEYSRKSSTEWWMKLHDQSRELVYPLLDGETRNLAAKFWSRFLETVSAAEFTPRLTHTDLSYGNLIIDPSTGRLNGVIDWGNTKVGDPAREFMGAFGMSRTLGEKTLSSYGLDKTGFRERITLYLAAESFEDIVTGVQESVERFTKEGLSHIRGRLVRTTS